MDALRVFKAARPLRAAEHFHRGVDSAILWSLGMVDVHRDDAPGEAAGLEEVDAERFWAESRVDDPVVLRVAGELPRRRRGTVRVLDLEGPSHGPGDHPGSRQLLAKARLNTTAAAGAPAVLILHGFAMPNALVDDYHAHLLSRRGAHTVRLDLPFHLRRRVVGRRSGDGFFSADPVRVREVLRQAVEDAAAAVAWMRAEMSPNVAVVGFSLGGLVAALLAARVPLAAALPVIPAADLPEIFLEYAPSRSRARAGILGDSGGPWGGDRATAKRVLDETLAPVVPRRLQPRTDPGRMAIVSATHDRIVGGPAARRLAATWGTANWEYHHGHITVMTAPGLTARMHSFVLDTAARPEVPEQRGAGPPSRPAVAAAG